MDSGSRVAIIGAGAWGLSCALSLLETGAKHVTVFDKGEPGSGSTGLAAGLVSTQLRQDADIRLVLETQAGLARLQAWGAKNERASAPHAYRRVGSLTLGASENAEKLTRLAVRVRKAGGEGKAVTGAEIRERWPIECDEDFVGLHTPGDGHVEGGDLVDLLRARIKDLGGQIHASRTAQLRLEDQQLRGLLVDGRGETFDAVVVAAGPWSKQVLAAADLSIALKPYRTQLAQLEYEHDDRLPVIHDLETFVYARPDGAHRALIGDGTEHFESAPDEYARTADSAFIEKIAAAASRRLRGGATATYRRGWAGLCVSTPDRDPLIGPYPGKEGLFVMSGDNGFGVMRCLALGGVAARSVQGRPTASDRRYRLSRVSMTEDFEVREGFEL